MKKILIDTACAQCQEWASSLLELWSGASLLVVLAFFVYQAWQSYMATRNSPVKQFTPGVGLTEFLRQQRNLEAVVAEVDISLGDYDNIGATKVVVRIKVKCKKVEAPQ